MFEHKIKQLLHTQYKLKDKYQLITHSNIICGFPGTAFAPKLTKFLFPDFSASSASIIANSAIPSSLTKY